MEHQSEQYQVYTESFQRSQYVFESPVLIRWYMVTVPCSRRRLTDVKEQRNEAAAAPAYHGERRKEEKNGGGEAMETSAKGGGPSSG
ncbi:hypothetical protein TRIUR3_11758 [Triticum urartu]|uniref:Uncharacterized protein n=1 Tax=Triticum urartu TaxID=4572 RepID=M7ZNH3_TRIUA|nr:hypothetical protein TRIUR3_11758 [Triticum urartu]